MSITNIIIVGLVGGAVTVGVAYFILAKLADFQWWWLAALFGAQFLALVLVAYVLEQKFGCGAKAAVSSGRQVVDWSNLIKTVAPVPAVVAKAPLPAEGSVNSADWQDLLKQLDQISKEPAVAAKPPVSAAALVCPPAPVMPTPAQPALASKASSTSPAFDFSIMAGALSTPAPAAAVVSPVVPTPPTTASIKSAPAPIVPPSPQTQTAPVIQGIDFASLFR